MMSSADKRKIRRLEKEREAEEKRENRVSKAKVAVGALATAGVAYAGYRYRGEIASAIDEVSGSVAEKVAKTTGNLDLQRRIQEQRNVMTAVSETYRQEEGGVLNTITSLFDNMSPEERNQKIRQRTGLLNKATDELARRTAIPADIMNAERDLVGEGYKTFQATQLRNLKDILKTKEFEESIGDRADDLYQVAAESTKDSKRNLFRRFDVEDKKTGEVDTELLKTLARHSGSDESSIDLDFQSDEDISQTAEKFQKAIEQSVKRTREQQQEYSRVTRGVASAVDASELAGNRYAEEKLFEESLRFRAFTQRDQEPDTPAARGLIKEGWDRLRLGDSESRVVERDGHLFIDNQATEGRTIDEQFSPSREGEQGFAANIRAIGRRLGVDKEEIDQALYSSDLFVDRETGQIMNLGVLKTNLEEALDFSIGNHQIPVIGINPLTYLKTHLGVGQDTSLRSAIYREGQVSAFTGDTLETRPDVYSRNEKSKGVLSRDYFQMGDTIYDGSIKEGLIESLDPEDGISYYERFIERAEQAKVAEGYEILDTQRGIGKRYADVMSGRRTESAKELNMLQEALGVDPENQTIIKDLKEAITNFESASFGKNQPIGITRDAKLGNIDKASQGIQEVGSKLSVGKQGLDYRTFDKVDDLFVDALRRKTGITDIEADMFKDQEGLMDLTSILSKSFEGDRSRPTDSLEGQIIADLEYQIRKESEAAIKNPRAYFNRKVHDFPDEILQGNISKLTGADKAVVYTGEDKLRGLVQEYAGMAMQAQGIDFSEKLSTSILSDTENIVKEISELNTSTEAKFFGKKITSAKTTQAKREITADWISHFGADESFENLQNIMGRVEPFGKKAVSADFESLTSTSYMPIKKHKGLLRSINEGLKDQAAGRPIKVNKELIGEGQSAFHDYEGTPLTPIFNALGEKINTITGHRGEVDTASITPWNMANNLNRPLEKFGLGIDSTKRQSAVSTVANLSLHRMIAPILAYNTAKSMDDFFLGGAGKRQLAQGYANLHLGIAGIRDKTGMTTISKGLDTYVPGMEHLRGSPIGMRASKLTFGLVGDGRSQEELEEYYRSGSDPVRKGRWWQMGSTTPWIGERIEYYRPNAYRRAMSDYEYTDTMHGSRREYWKNHWMPNIYNPLAPVKHFLTDPYHYEKKHQDSRPYAVTGGFASLQAIPVIGSSVDAAVSSILKPSKEHSRLRSSHREYLRNENEALVSAYLGPSTGGQLNITPRGKASLTTPAPVVNIIDEESGLADEQSVIEDDMRFYSERERMGTGVAPQRAYQTRRGPIQTVKDWSRSILRSFNTSLAYDGGFPAGYNPNLAGIPTEGRSFGPHQVHSQINPYKINELDDVVNSTGFNDPAGRFMYASDQVRSMGGFFSYMSLSATGILKRDDRIRLEDSSRYRDFNEGFWSLGLGGYDGLDGSISEIGRRFTAPEQRRRYYNPIRNQMPDWMPGQDYFIDFQHGDPYKKVDYGEIRLPGEAYESIHNVQKDEFGNYSAFDRYKILADVAPYSDQYRFARTEVALLNQNGLLSEEKQNEYRRIREQVSNKNKKHNFETRRFGNANVDREMVTITKIIDQNTFLTEEYANNPIKLAGVSIKADDEENVALMREILKPGTKVEVALDSDPMNRVRDDMLDTMRGVVYAPKYSGFNRNVPLRGGQNVNQFLAGQSEDDGGTIGIKDDGSAVATAALHSEGQITVGKNIETLVHDVLPNVPVVNILADKFYPVRTAVEEYEKQLYSKQFRAWTKPVTSWAVPMFETAANMNPVWSSIRGAGIATMFSRDPQKQALYAKVGGSIYGAISGARAISDFAQRSLGDGERWMPRRRRDQRELDEYFDKVQYVKYKGLYEQAKELALKEEGVDIDAYLGAVEEEGQSNDNYKTYLEGRKKELNIAAKSTGSETVRDYSKAQLKEINEKLKEIDTRRPSGQVGSYTALAFRYKEEYESTLYGAQDTYDYMKIYRALPKHDKEFFTAFQKATPEERQKILKMVPKNQRNIYRQQWGLDAKEEDSVSVEQFFSDYKIPKADWEGWRPDVSLENIKIKVMQNEGMELTEANYWDEHEDRADMDPSQPIAIQKLPSMPMSQAINQGRLKKALEGAGLRDVRVGMRTSASDVGYFNTQMNIVNEREEEINEGIRGYLNS